MVLVTGGAGFIGSHLVDRLLADGRRVVAVDDLSTGRLANLAWAETSDRLDFRRLDITDGRFERVVAEHRPSVIFHLAAQANVRAAVADPLRDAHVNVLGTIAVVEAARRHGVRKVVFASSGGCIYGEPSPGELPLDESSPLIPGSPYGASKVAAEHYLSTYRQLYRLGWTSLALGNVYGPRQDPTGEAGVVAIFAERMRDGQPVVIYGDGEQTRDFVYVDDAVRAFVLAMRCGDDRRFNIGTGERTSVNRLYAQLKRLVGYRGEPVTAPPRAGELRHNALDSHRAAQEMNWTPRTTLGAGLAVTVDWFREHRTSA